MPLRKNAIVAAGAVPLLTMLSKSEQPDVQRTAAAAVKVLDAD